MTAAELVKNLQKVILSCDRMGNYTLEDTDDESRSAYFQTDWDYPCLANNLVDIDIENDEVKSVWSPPSNETDGTITCPVTGKSAMEMITEAGNALDDYCDCILYIGIDTFSSYCGEG